MKKFYLLLFLQFVPFLVDAQEFKGRITTTSGEPITGAYVLDKNSKAHTHSNDLGYFEMKETVSGDTLCIMHIGYETVIYVINAYLPNLQIELKESYFDLGEVVVGQNTKQVNIVAALDLKVDPVNSSQELLRQVPGLFIGQHAGGGKAEQIFLRGFDIDHGTDVQISVDGMPVNMVSHAHGQGYADLHFVIPETIESIDYGKGAYYAEKGNFSTAGYVEFNTKQKIAKSEFGVSAGRFNTLRFAGLLKLLDTEKHHIYAASEYTLTDGYFESNQNFNRNNLLAKYTGEFSNNRQITLSASHFSSSWDASGQIPQRLVDQKVISRFGAVDDTEGGSTKRTNLTFSYKQPIHENLYMRSNFFYSIYDFQLYSNFTFFLNDPINGDQIRQKEERQIFGFENVWSYSTFFNKTSALLQTGIGLRSDLIKNNELSNTLNRSTTLNRVQFGDVDEKNIYAFADLELDVGNWLFQPGLRLDYFKFSYEDKLMTEYSKESKGKAVVSPKFNIIYNLNHKVQLYLKTGIGFHTNDSRVILQNESKAIIPAAYGADLGTFFKPHSRVYANVALWYLGLEQEFVYVGDEGVVEPSGRTRRLGVDASIRYQMYKLLFANADINYAFARSLDEPENLNYIPLAPELTSTIGLSLRKDFFNVGLQVRHLGDRAANEDNSLIARGYTITDLNANYTFKNLTIGFVIENLFNQEWNETQFATETRLRDEQVPVDEIHFTPGSPFFVKGEIRYQF